MEEPGREVNERMTECDRADADNGQFRKRSVLLRPREQTRLREEGWRGGEEEVPGTSAREIPQQPNAGGNT